MLNKKNNYILASNEGEYL